jgi:hypothetical protein
MTITFMSIALLVGQGSAPKPEAFVKFERARSQLRTARIACTVTGGLRLVGMPVRCLRLEMAKNGDVLWAYDGDLEGVLARDEFGYPVDVGSRQTLVQDGTAYRKDSLDFGGSLAPPGTWDRRGNMPDCDMSVDLRTIGMAGSWDSLEGQEIDTVLAQATKDCAEFSVAREGSIHCVTAHWPNGREVTYEIDESKGWNASRIRGTGTGGTWECVIQLEQFGKTWFPRMVTLSRNGEMQTEWLVTRASFNAPDDPEGFTLDELGFEVGMQVGVRGRPPGPEALFWDGEKPVPDSEIRRRLDSGELQPGPTLKRMWEAIDHQREYRSAGADLLDRLRTSPRVLESFISRWEYYVAMFCQKYQLEEEQRSKAYRALRRAQEGANQYLSKSREKIELLLKKRDAGEVSAEQANNEFTKLRAPVDDIFEKQLKPGLAELPTHKQREAAEERDKQNPSRATHEPQNRPPKP